MSTQVHAKYLAARCVILAALLCGCTMSDDGQCPSHLPGCAAGGEESEARWLPIATLQSEKKNKKNKIAQLANILGCSGSGREGLARFCLATRPPGATQSCDFSTAISIDASEVSARCWRRCIFDTPDLNAYAVDAEVHFVPLTREVYRATAFLDSRSLKHGVGTCSYPLALPVLERLAASALQEPDRQTGRRVHFIFHLAHTGSTLLSRAIGEVPNAFVLREPRLLWDMSTSLADAPARMVGKAWNNTLLPLLSRRYSAEDTVIVKASSRALRFMRPALRFSEEVRAVFMYSSLRTHLAVILARALADEKERLPDHIYEGLEVKQQVFKEFSASTSAYKQLSIPRKMTLAWLKRMLFMAALPKEQVHLLRMDHFLDKVASTLQEVSNFFGLALSSSKAESIASSSIFAEYAKDSSVPWNASIQKTMMQGRSQVYVKEIEDGMAFAEELLAKHKVLRKHLKRWLRD